MANPFDKYDVAVNPFDKYDTPEKPKVVQDRTFLGASAEAGGRAVLGGLATLVDTLNPFTLSEQDAATLYKDDPEGFKKVTEKSASMVLSRFANEQARISQENMQRVKPEKGALSGESIQDLEYATLDPNKSALLSPTRVAGDLLGSLPSTIVLAVSGYLTRGRSLVAAEQATTAALARGATAAEAQAVGRTAAIEMGAKTMATTGAIGEGALGFAGGKTQATLEASQIKPEVYEASPDYQTLLAQGYTPETARGYLAAKVGQESGLISGAVDAATNLVGGRVLGKIIGGGGPLVGRTLKGFGTEGLTETVQSTGEQIGQNVAMRQINPSLDLSKGVGEAAAQGFVVGGLMGGSTSAVFGSAQRDNSLNQLKNSTDAGSAAIAANAAAGDMDMILRQVVDTQLTPAVTANLAGDVIPTPVQSINAAPQQIAGNPLAAASLSERQALIDRQTELIAEANTPGIPALNRENLLAQAQTGRGTPEPGAAANFVDLTPMTAAQAQTRLAVLRNTTANAGGNSLELAVVPHPTQAATFAIAKQALPNLDLGAPAAGPSAAQAQNQIEASALAGKETNRLAEDQPRQEIIARAMRNVEQRGGVASPAEAQIFREANLGQPYNSVDPSLAPDSSVDQKLTQATGIPLVSKPRSSTTQKIETPFTYSEQTGNKVEKAELPIFDPVQAYVNIQRRTNTPAANAFTRSYDNGTITDADVQQALDVEQRGSRTADQVLAVVVPTPLQQEGLVIERNRARPKDEVVEATPPKATNDFGFTPAPAVNQNVFKPLDVLLTLQDGIEGKATKSYKDSGVLPALIEAGLIDDKATITPKGYKLLEVFNANDQVAAQRAVNDAIGTKLQAPQLETTNPNIIVQTDAKLSTPREQVPGSTATINDKGTQHTYMVAESGALPGMTKLIQQLARRFGKKVVFFNSDSLKADGFVSNADNKTLFINAKSQMSPLAVFGHELLHLLKRDNPIAYRAIAAVVAKRMDAESRAQFRQDYGSGANIEELSADLMGNAFQDENFLTDVFTEIAESAPEGEARNIIMRLAAAISQSINAAMDVISKMAPGAQKFQADELVKNLEEIRAALKTALVTYAKDQKIPAMQMEAERAQAESRTALTASAAISGEAPEITKSSSRSVPSQWKATEQERRLADAYERENGIRPYESEGQLQPQVAEATLSVKREYEAKDLAKGRENHPVLGVPLNKNGTVTLYFPTTNEEARRVAKDRRLRGTTPASNRIYLTNESSAPAVAAKPGNIDQPLGGANVLIQVDPALLQFDAEYAGGRKDFFIQLAEGQAFANKMKQTKLFTLDAPRTKAISKSTTINDIGRSFNASIEAFKALSPTLQKERLKQARVVLKDEHNIGTLLGENGKLQKTRLGDYGLTFEDKSVASMGLGLASAQAINEKSTTCINSARCEGLCLGETSGQNWLYGGDGQFRSGPRLSQYLKTEALVMHPEEFAVVMYAEVRLFEAWANKATGVEVLKEKGQPDVVTPKQVYQAAIRFNVTSDFPPKTFESLINAFPEVQWYDYTKLDTSAIAPNHHLTYSSTGVAQVVDGKTLGIPNKATGKGGANWAAMVKKLDRGFNVAMAFTSRNDIPAFLKDEVTGKTYQVWNGDNYDARFLDPKRDDGVGMIVGLTNKDRTGKPEDAALKHDGFFVDYNPERDGDTLLIRDQDKLAGKKPERKTFPIAVAQTPERTGNNGEFSNATNDITKSSQRAAPNTPEFRAMFGQTQIVDENGEPKVMYHATRKREGRNYTPESDPDRGNIFSTFITSPDGKLGEGIYASAIPEYSESYAPDGLVMPIYMNIVNPLVINIKAPVQYKTIGDGKLATLDSMGTMEIDKQLQSAVQEISGGKKRLKDLYGSELREMLQSNDYDGIVVVDEFGDFVEANAFEPTQIKSAIGNNGEYSQGNPNISKSTPRFYSASEKGSMREKLAEGQPLFSRQRIVGESKRDYTPEQRAFFENTGRTVTEPTLKERVKELRKDFALKMTQGMVDPFASIKKLDFKSYILARMSKGTVGALEAMLRYGKVSLNKGVYDSDMSGGFLDRVGIPLQGELEDFLWWIAANRAERLSKEDRENLFTATDIQAGKTLSSGTTEYDYTMQHGADAGKVTRDRTKIYRDSLKTFDEFNKNALDMAEQQGLIDPESRALWEHEFYVPFYRIAEEDGSFKGGNIKDGLVRQKAFERLKGGSEKLNSDLLANTMQNWSHLLEAGAKNAAAASSLKAAEKVGAATLASSNTPDAVWYMGPVTRTIPKGQTYEEGGVEKISDGTAEITSTEKIYYTVSDPYILASLSAINYTGMKGPVMDAMSSFKHALTVGVTASPYYKVKNLMRDSVQAVATSPLSYNIAKNLVEGYQASDRKSQTYVSALASGGLIRFGNMLEGNEASRTRMLIDRGVDKSTILDSDQKVKAVFNKFKQAFDAYNEVGARGEEMNRAALYKQLIVKGIGHDEASFMARDLMDFSLQGTFQTVRFLTQVVPFMNARLQGLYKLGKAANEDPKRFSAVLGATALLSVGLLLAYKDDDDWKKREDWDRNNNWWFKFGGVAFRIPKPFEIGAISTLAERGLEFFISKEMTGRRLGKNVSDIILDNLSMNPIAQFAKPLLDIYANKDSFTGRPIESMGMERLKSDYRFNSHSSMLARGVSTAGNAVSGAVNKEFLSPVQIDHLVRGYFGWLGTFVVGATDMVLRPLTGQATQPASDMWKVASGNMVSSLPTDQSRYVTQMYEQAKVLEQAYATWRQLQKDRKPEEAREFLEANREKLTRYKQVEGVKRNEAKFNEMIRMVERSSSLDAEQKAARISNIKGRMDVMARRVAEGYV